MSAVPSITLYKRKFASPELAAYHMLQYFSESAPYSRQPLQNAFRIISAAAAQGTYICLWDKRRIFGLIVWHEISKSKYENIYRQDVVRIDLSCDLPKDAIMIVAIHAQHRRLLRLLMSDLKKSNTDKELFWDRHRGRIGSHRNHLQRD